MLQGARQVGKTTLIRAFGKKYAQTIFLNLEKPEDRNFFEAYENVHTIMDALFLSRNLTSELKDTLLFIDEIQESPKAIQLLRYFYEEMPELPVIAAGSLLEFAMRKVKSFPVGRVEYLFLYPLNFSEFLQAINHHTALEQLQQMPVKAFAHTTLLNLFHTYAIMGGMPEVVRTYVQERNMQLLPSVYESIWGTYQNDVEKYAKNDTERKVIKHIMATAPFYVDQRIKFQHFGNSNYRSREVGEAMRTLDDAKVIQLMYPTTDMEVPLIPDLKKSPKLQLLDTGLINHVLSIQAEMLGLKDMSNAYKGSIVPHLINQELISLNSFSNKKPYFWVREKNQASSEVDLLYVHQDKVIPIEIKSGSTGSLKSLHQFVARASHPYAVRMYAGEFKVIKTKTSEGKPYLLMNMPYYLGTRIPEYVDWFINHNTL
ncbi:AAA family ATPase [Catalinimonas sp. 4WD22]|uniref:ATP-binding protein n=1 Tax=Catalinimonas locisalis TaxID=3133978 RepID=UPI00310164FD